LVIAAGVFAVAAGLSGCTSDSHDLPSLEGTLTPTPSANLEAIAKTYYDCMTDAGISVEYQLNGSGQLSEVHFTKYGFVLWRESDDFEMSASTADQDPAAVQKAENDFFSKPYTGPALMIDGVDYSEEYAKCLAQSGYDEQRAQGSVIQNPVLVQQQLAANNKWAQCARENGWPDVKDSVVPEDDMMMPVVYLPSGITDDQLRQLIDACPNFDPDQQEKMQQWYQDNPTPTGYPDDYISEPNFSVEDQSDTVRRDQLYAILNEKMNEYNEQHGG
jgi:hypothetical protein